MFTTPEKEKDPKNDIARLYEVHCRSTKANEIDMSLGICDQRMTPRLSI
jgi:hypothetical protein